ncbi:MAG: hypothetical protein FJ100_06740, partial [Deltaproteobacteria bacterium]|nr:hypothetical protein [Deltaproteobacteria bacterium]
GPRWALGRLWAPLGCQQAPIDGLSVAHPLGASAELSAFAGLVPSAGSTAPQGDLWRVGAAAHGRAIAGDWQAQGQVAASAGGGDRATVGVSMRAAHPRWGSADGAVDLGLGAPTLSRTAWSSLAAPTGVRPTYGTAQWQAPAWSGWLARARYTHAQVEPTRDAALGLPGIGAHSASFDDVAVSVQAPQWRRWLASGSVWGTWWRSADPWLDRRLGGTVTVRMPSWPAANGNVDLALVGQYGALLSGASAAIGAEFSPSDPWRWHGRVRWSVDRVEAVAVVSQAIDARMGADFGRHPWIVSASAGVRQTLTGAAANWLDATLAVARRL